MIKITIMAEKDISQAGMETREPICANDIAVAIVELEKKKMALLKMLDDFEPIMRVKESPDEDD